MDNPVADKDWELPPKNKDWRFNDMERNFSDESFLLFFSNAYPNVFQEIAGAFHEEFASVGLRGKAWERTPSQLSRRAEAQAAGDTHPLASDPEQRRDQMYQPFKGPKARRGGGARAKQDYLIDRGATRHSSEFADHEFYAPPINLRSFSPGHLEFGGRKTGGRGKKMMMPGHYKFADADAGKKGRGSGINLIRRLGLLASKPQRRNKVRLTGGLQGLHPNHPNYSLLRPYADDLDIHKSAQISQPMRPSRPPPGTEKPMNADPKHPNYMGKLEPKRGDGSFNEFVAGGLIRAGLAVGKRVLPAIGRGLKSLGRGAKAAGKRVKTSPGEAAKSFGKGGLMGGAAAAGGSALRKLHGSSRPTITGADPSKAPKKRTGSIGFLRGRASLGKPQENRDISSRRSSKGLPPTTKPESERASPPTADATAGRLHRQRKHGFSPAMKTSWDKWRPKAKNAAGPKFPWMSK